MERQHRTRTANATAEGPIVAVRSREQGRTTRQTNGTERNDRHRPKNPASSSHESPTAQTSHPGQILDMTTAAGLRAFGRWISSIRLLDAASQFVDGGFAKAGAFKRRGRCRRSSAMASFVPDYRCGAAPELTLSRGLKTAPDSLLGPPVGVSTAGGHKILWLEVIRQQGNDGSLAALRALSDSPSGPPRGVRDHPPPPAPDRRY